MTRRLSLLLLVGCVCALGVARGATRDAPFASAEATISPAADSLLLDQYPDTYAAYSLRRLRSDYQGPAIRVRRASDSAEQDFGFTSGGNLDVSAIESFLGGSDGTVVTWYSQVEGMPSLTGNPGPEIASGGTVHLDAEGLPQLYFPLDSGKLNYSGASTSISTVDQTTIAALDVESIGNENFGVISELESANDFRLYAKNGEKYWAVGDGSNIQELAPWEKDIVAVSVGPTEKVMYRNDSNIDRRTYSTESGSDTYDFRVGGGAEMHLSELVICPTLNETDYWARYDNINNYWQAGPTNTNRQAILPQTRNFQIALYNWLDTISVSDITLPDGTLQYDNSYGTEDELADLWLQIRGLTASSVTRAEPEWYTLDTNGKGIEGTGAVRANHNPKGGSYGGNPPRSWQNEPAFWYQLDIPLSGGGQGNPWYKSEAMGRRAMIVSSVDLMMHAQFSGSYQWFDMVGKAFLGMAEAYRYAGGVMPEDVQDAYEEGMGIVIDHLTARGPRAVNTNMDMFALHGAAELYMATDNSTLKTKCVEMVKDALFGYTDGELETKHKVFKAGNGYDGGVFDPSGFIMEGDQPDNFYQGESILHLAGALAAVTDRSTGSVPNDWQFLEEVFRRTLEFRSYQVFFDPESNGVMLEGGAGFAGRTGSSAAAGQANKPHKHLFTADNFGTDYVHVDEYVKDNLPTVSEMETQISDKLSSMDSKMSSNYTDSQPDEWSGWSPWTKPVPYLPDEGWYSTLKDLKNNDDPSLDYPAVRGDTWNKALGGSPTGNSYWSYKGSDSNGKGFGFFVEAQARQGGYGGWYGGKIETFWVEGPGIISMSRHGKGGCNRSGRNDDNFEDSECWFNLDAKAGNHVWGRDENGNGFTTLLLRGRELNRNSNFDGGKSPTQVTVNNVFNDPNSLGNGGEKTGSEIEKGVEVENEFTLQSNGLKVAHTITSDEVDEVNELWASIPVHLRDYSKFAGPDDQEGMDPTTIEYWDGSQWVVMPEDTDNDGVPEIVSTDALRLGRKYPFQNETKYAYVSLANTQDLRLSEWVYHDPYQTSTSARTVHIDLHGNPGTAKTLPASKSVSYTIQTTEPALGALFTDQDVSLREGSNLISAALAPEHAHMDSVFADVAADVIEVKNEAGERYRPADGVNEIGHWDRDEAYVVYAESGATLSLQGTPVDTSSIALDEGWNWVPYSRPSALAVEEALTSIQDALVMVKDETGRAYVPGEGIEELSTLTPGEGYRVYVSSPTTLTYPAGSN
jgi:hypothetical protein